MATYKQTKRQACQSAIKERPFPPSIDEHATHLEHDFSTINERFIKCPSYSIRWCKSTKKLMRDGIEEAVDNFLAINPTTQLSVKEDKMAFSLLALTKIGGGIRDVISPSVPEAEFLALHKSYQDLVRKVRGLQPVPTQCDSFSKDLSFNEVAKEDELDSSSNQMARLSTDSRPLADFDENARESKARGMPVGHFGRRIQGSDDLSVDQGRTEGKIKEEKYIKTWAMASPDPAIITISLGDPLAADHYRFTMAFRDERIGKSLARMRPREIWQLVCDSIDHDPDIPFRTLTSPWIADVGHQKGNCLTFKTKSEGDLNILTANVQWARDLYDTLAAGIKIYKIVLEKVKIKTDKYKDTALIIHEIRKENSREIPSLNHIGAVRDVMMLPNPVSKTEQDVYADYILFFGSREAAYTVLDKGLHYRNKKHSCVIYSPETQWPQRCSFCQAHSHAARDCPSMPICRKCGYAQATNSCISATTECASCHGDHRVLNKEWPNRLEAEETAHRSYHFPAGEDLNQQTWPIAKNLATLALNSTALPLPVFSKPQNSPTMNPSIAFKSQIAREITLSTNTKSRTIDENKAFFIAREKLRNQNTRSQTKRKAIEAEYLMSGALQIDGPEKKRTKKENKEEEGPVWPTGYDGYEPPSLRKGV